LPLHGNGWNPSTITRTVDGLATATETTRVDTDAGEGFLKALGNPEGPHALACELVGSLIADWFGLKTFDFSLIEVHDRDEVVVMGRSRAQPGKAFICRAEDKGYTWGGDAQTISGISNREDITRLVILDTWLRNCDRHAPDGGRINLKNVFLLQRTSPSRKLELIAMDFTHAFTCGGPLDRTLGYIEKIQDEGIYGLFPEFRPHISRDEVISCVARLAEFNRGIADRMLAYIPAQWDVEDTVRSLWKKFLLDRAHFTARMIESRLFPESAELPYPGGS
jgi:hypothetical protein